jgi:hypothetical protein
MAEQRVIIESGTVTSIQGVAAGTNFYTSAITDVPGVVAANTFLSLFNPVGSGKTITVYGTIVLPWASAATAVASSMTIYRTSAASGGTQVVAGLIDKFYTGSPASIAEVRKGNPTITTVATSLGGFPRRSALLRRA